MATKTPSPFMSTGSGNGGWPRSVAALLAGILVTLLMFVLLERSASSGQNDAVDLQEAAITDPFLPAEAGTDETASKQAAEDCFVMQTALDDINDRMSQGVTEEQARYFRARRNKIYMLMRERCGL